MTIGVLSSLQSENIDISEQDTILVTAYTCKQLLHAGTISHVVSNRNTICELKQYLHIDSKVPLEK